MLVVASSYIIYQEKVVKILISFRSVKCSQQSTMSDPQNGSQVTFERRRREEAVKVGQMQVLMMEAERKLESKERKIQQLLRRNQGLESLLEEIEKENQEEQKEAELEAARRRKVVKLWKMQAKMMGRRRELEKLQVYCLELGSAVQEHHDNLETLNEMMGHVGVENLGLDVELIFGLTDTDLSSSVPDAELKLTEDLIDLETQIEEEEEEARAFR